MSDPADPTSPDATQVADVVAGLRGRFRARAGEQAGTLADAVAAGDLETVAALAHKLAGSAAIFGYAEIGSLARALDQLAQDGGDPMALRDSADRLVVLLRDAAQDAD